MNVPIITLEVQAMKHTIKAALSKYAVQIDAEIKSAVDEFCTPENIKRVVQEAAKSAIAASIKESVHSYFVHGKGREQVAEAVREQLELDTVPEPALEQPPDKIPLGTHVFYKDSVYRVTCNSYAYLCDITKVTPLGRKGDVVRAVRVSALTMLEG